MADLALSLANDRTETQLTSLVKCRSCKHCINLPQHPASTSKWGWCTKYKWHALKREPRICHGHAWSEP